MQQITTFINSVGFPIVACVFMYIDRQKMTSAIMELSVTMKEVCTRLESLENNKE